MVWEFWLKKVHLLVVESKNSTFNVELRVLNLSSGVPFFCILLWVEQVSIKGVCVKDNASRGFLLTLMLMGERAFLKGLCTASLLSFVIGQFTPLPNGSTAYKHVASNTYKAHLHKITPSINLYNIPKISIFPILYCQIKQLSLGISQSSNIPLRYLYDSNAVFSASYAVSSLLLSLPPQCGLYKALNIIILYSRKMQWFLSVCMKRRQYLW